MPNETITKEERQDRAYLVRIYEASCEIDHPTEDELKFRLAAMKKIAKEFNFAELRQYGFSPAPANGASQPKRA